MNPLSQVAQVGSFASHVTSIFSYGSDAGFTIAIFLIFFIFAWYVGRGPFLGLLISLYVSFGLYQAFPYMGILPSAPALTSVLTRIALFVFIAIISYLILRRSVVSDFLALGVFGIILLSLIATGFIFALAYQTFNVSSIYTFSPTFTFLFGNSQFFFWWAAAPLIGLFIFAR